MSMNGVKQQAMSMNGVEQQAMSMNGVEQQAMSMNGVEQQAMFMQTFLFYLSTSYIYCAQCCQSPSGLSANVV